MVPKVPRGARFCSPLLRRQQLSLALTAPAISADAPGVGHHPVARDDERDRIGGARAGNGSDRLRFADALCDLGVRARLAVRDPLQRAPDLPLKCRGLDVDREVERWRTAAKVLGDRLCPLGSGLRIGFDLRGRILPSQIGGERRLRSCRSSPNTRRARSPRPAPHRPGSPSSR